ncbi:hypothetical protein IJH24_02820 [Candidatus Saccharibacteria bacterium]|nr:hypothetical protein [Candidatus Saccharibacteria bacterium]
MVKKGDTLIEVTLAIGIFSMVAIAVVAVMVSGTSNAQTALETTLAREEIDTQAEALRFIHAAYLADKESGEGKDAYTQLWKQIVNNAYNPKKNTADNNAKFLQYSPSSCQEIYANPSTDPIGKAFVINPRKLSNLTVSNINKVYNQYSSVFKMTTTYPRLVYTDAQESNQDALIDKPSDTSDLKYAEGIYVLAVVDPGTTNIVGTGNAAAYFDFYIRTCWYGMGSETPSTISTVIRLYDPEGLGD